MIKLRCVFEMGFAHSAYHDDVRQFDVEIIAFDHNHQGTVGRVIGTALLSMTAALEPATPPIVAPPFCELMLADFGFYEAYQAFVNADATVKADLGIHHPVESLIHVQHVELVADLCEYRACILNTIGTFFGSKSITVVEAPLEALTEADLWALGFGKLALSDWWVRSNLSRKEFTQRFPDEVDTIETLEESEIDSAPRISWTPCDRDKVRKECHVDSVELHCVEQEGRRMMVLLGAERDTGDA